MSELLTNIRSLFDDQKFAALPKGEQRAQLMTLKEAESNGASLHNPTALGIPPSLALGIYRRDGWKCMRCQAKEHIQLHHKGGIKNSHWSDVGKRNKQNNLVIICKSCHNAVHDEDRAGGPENFKPEE